MTDGGCKAAFLKMPRRRMQCVPNSIVLSSLSYQPFSFRNPVSLPLSVRVTVPGVLFLVS